MWDMKPECAGWIRGEFKPIATKLPGLQVSDTCHAWPDICTGDFGSFGASRRKWFACVGCLHFDDRPRSRRCHDITVAAGSDRLPTLDLYLSSFRPPAAGVVPHVCLPYITKEAQADRRSPATFRLSWSCVRSAVCPQRSEFRRFRRALELRSWLTSVERLERGNAVRPARSVLSAR